MASEDATFDLAEVWVESLNGEPRFSHTVITAFFGSDAKYAEVQQRLPNVDLEIAKQTLIPIPATEIYPEARWQTMCFPEDTPLDNYFIKRPNIRAYGQLKGSATIAEDFLSELEIYRCLKSNPHENLPGFRGAITEAGRVIGIVLDRYADTLQARISELSRYDREECLRAIKAAVDHLHRLGLAHNDICPNNIMGGYCGKVVLIDLDSCRPYGASMTHSGTPDWNNGFTTHSSRTNDELALTQLKTFLEQRSIDKVHY